MKFMLDCGFNLCVYGVGSKYCLLNLFAQKFLATSQYVIIENGYHTGSNMKKVVEDIKNWFAKVIYKNQLQAREIFPRSQSMHEQIMSLKREFNKLA